MLNKELLLWIKRCSKTLWISIIIKIIFRGSVLEVFNSFWKFVWYEIFRRREKTFWYDLYYSTNTGAPYQVSILWVGFHTSRFILSVVQHHTDNICMCQFIQKHAIVHMCIKAFLEWHHRNLQTFVSYVHFYIELFIFTTSI